jgi:hypothetical protein
MREQSPPAFAACSSRFGCLLLPVRSRGALQSSGKQARSEIARLLIRESEEAAKEGKGSFRKTRRLVSPKGARCGATALRAHDVCGSPRSGERNAFRSFVRREGMPRTDACSFGADAPLCASSPVAGSLRAALCLASLGAARGLAWSTDSMVDSGDESKRDVVGAPGRRRLFGVLVDGAVGAAVYEQITSTSARSQQSLMVSALRPATCEPGHPPLGIGSNAAVTRSP